MYGTNTVNMTERNVEMTVQQLIDELSQYPPDAKVYAAGAERGGYEVMIGNKIQIDRHRDGVLITCNDRD
jgi:hypothetical protein